jgi:integrase
LQGFVSWLIAYRGERGRLSDRSIRNAVAPLRLCLLAAAEDGLVERDVPGGLLLPRRRGGRGWDFEQGRFLTRAQLGRLLAEIPEEWRPFFDLLASTGPRFSEAIALRWCDLDLEEPAHLWVRRSIVDGVVGAPKSRFGRRSAFTPYATPARPCWSSAASRLYASNAGWATTRPPTRSMSTDI